MFLKRLVLLNWGNLPNRSYEFGSVNLFSGGSGSGKTTMGDALQTLMTAAYGSLYQYNPGQNESKQRGKAGSKHSRSLASYVLGCDDGSYARIDPTDGYIAGVFHPSPDESAPPFTALMGIRAHIDRTAQKSAAREDDLLFMILPEKMLKKDDLVITQESFETIVTLDQLETHFIKKFGKQGFEKYDKKSAYLRRLYGAFRGLRESVAEKEAMAAARAFSRFMAYKPITNIDDFVSREVLEAKDLGDIIQDISQQLHTIHSMEKDAKQLQVSITTLQTADNYAQAYIEAWLELNTLEYLLAQNEYYQLQQQWLKKQKLLKSKQEESIRVDNDITSNKAIQGDLYDEEVRLAALRQGIPVLQQKDELEKEKINLNNNIVQKFSELSEQNTLLDANYRNIQLVCTQLDDKNLQDDLAVFISSELTDLRKQNKEHTGELSIDLGGFINTSFVDDKAHLDDLLQEVKSSQLLQNDWYHYWHQERSEVGDSRINQLVKIVQIKEKGYQDLRMKKSALDIKIQRLKNKKTNYPPYVVAAIKAIKNKYPEADPSILCDHIEVADSSSDWQASIEGYLGGARFSIIVDSDYESRVIQLIKSTFKQAKIIQGERAQLDVERKNHRLKARSIINVLEFTHEIARYYLTASYGNVMRVDSAEELRLERRALTKDGMGAGSYSMWGCMMPDEQLVFGENARLRALKALEEELKEVDTVFNQVNDEMIAVKQFHKAITTTSLLTFSEKIEEMMGFHRSLLVLERKIEQLDLGEGKKLDDQLEKLKIDKGIIDGKLESLMKDKGKLGEEINKYKQESSKLSERKDDSQEIVVECGDAIERIATIWSEFDPEHHIEQADVDAKTLNTTVKINEKDAVNQTLNKQERNISKKIDEHNQTCHAGDSVIYRGYEMQYDTALFTRICEVQTDIKYVYNRLKNNILIEKEKNLQAIRSSFDNAFISNFCHSIYHALNVGEQQIKQLNKELENHFFGADREQFRFDSSWVPEFKEYAAFFKEVVNNPQLGEASGLFDEHPSLSEKVIPTRDKVKNLLLGKDNQKAQQELKRISDYRNYRRYEIYKEVEGKDPIPLSEYGTGSGGQLETPAYIIRSASITSSFRFAEGQNHLRMVLVDEAFSFMDESRSREIINYLTDSLGLQLIFIMPSNKCGPFMNIVNNQFVCVKCPSSKPRGELKTQVQVSAEVLKKEKVEQLWKRHKELAYQQGELSFMNTFLESE